MDLNRVELPEEALTKCNVLPEFTTIAAVASAVLGPRLTRSSTTCSPSTSPSAPLPTTSNIGNGTIKPTCSTIRSRQGDPARTSVHKHADRHVVYFRVGIEVTAGIALQPTAAGNWPLAISLADCEVATGLLVPLSEVLGE